MNSIVRTAENSSSVSRRRFTRAAAALCAAPWIAACASGPRAAKPLSVGALFAGRVDDRGFMESGWRGLERARTELGIQTTFIDGVEPKKELLAAALAKLAGSGVDLVVAHGGQNNEACAEVAARFPQVKFVVTQGAVTSANLASYDVLQEESAYLAGVLAARTTRTGIVGHMSGIRVRPGLKGRAAYAAGVRDGQPPGQAADQLLGQPGRQPAFQARGAGADRRRRRCHLHDAQCGPRRRDAGLPRKERTPDRQRDRLGPGRPRRVPGLGGRRCGRRRIRSRARSARGQPSLRPRYARSGSAIRRRYGLPCRRARLPTSGRRSRKSRRTSAMAV